MSAPRIDTTRNTIDALILRLAEFRAEVHDIHDLAYNRKRAAEEARVRGGSRDYALDSNGDMIARAAYIDVAREMFTVYGILTDAIDKVRSHLTSGTAPSAFDRAAVAPKHEVAHAIAKAKARRSAAPSFDLDPPHPIVKQPPLAYIEPTVELDNLRNAVVKMARGTKPDRSRLTPAEQEAWRRAASPEPATKAG